MWYYISLDANKCLALQASPYGYHVVQDAVGWITILFLKKKSSLVPFPLKRTCCVHPQGPPHSLKKDVRICPCALEWLTATLGSKEYDISRNNLFPNIMFFWRPNVVQHTFSWELMIYEWWCSHISGPHNSKSDIANIFVKSFTRLLICLL